MRMTIDSTLQKNLSPLVIKLGGSLANHVPGLVSVLRLSPRPILLVPGGGSFANAVRLAGLDDESAHWEAIAAMEKYGRTIARLGIPVTSRLFLPDQTILFFPLRSLREQDPLPHSWDVTSDTIAAWAASELRIDLLLLKSVDGIRRGDTMEELVTSPRDTDVVDPYLIPYVLKNRVNTFILNGTRPEQLARYLKGERVPGTRISTTF